MAVNLINKIEGIMTPEVVGSIARAFHEATGPLQVAVDNTIPGLLDSLVKVTASKLGAEALLQSVRQQDETILEHLSDELMGDNHKALARSGLSVLRSLLGGRGIDRLSGHIATSSGLSQQVATSLLGIQMPILLAVIKRKLSHSKKLNSAGVTHLLASQREIITDALPIIFGTDHQYREKLTVASEESHPDRFHEQPPVAREKRLSLLTRFFPSLILPALLVPLVVFFVYHWISTSARNPMSLPGTQAASEVTLNVDKLAPSEIAALHELQGILSRVTRQLGAISDEQTARLQRVQLKREISVIARLGKKMQGMSPDTKKQAAALVAASLPQWQGTLDRVNRMPDGVVVLGLVDPVVDHLIQLLVDTFI